VRAFVKCLLQDEERFLEWKDVLLVAVLDVIQKILKNERKKEN